MPIETCFPSMHGAEQRITDMEDSDFVKIHEQCASFRQALILDSDGSADHALAVASCLLRRDQEA